MEILYINQCIWRQNLDTRSQLFIYYSEIRHCFPWLTLNFNPFFKAHLQCTNNKYNKSCQAKLKHFKLYRIKIQQFHCSSLNYTNPWTVFLCILNSTCNVITFNKGVWSISLFKLQTTFNGIFRNKKFSIALISSRLLAVTTNDNVFHLAELGRSQRCSTGCTRVCYGDVDHIRILSVWSGAVAPGNNNLASSDRVHWTTKFNFFFVPRTSIGELSSTFYA